MRREYVSCLGRQCFIDDDDEYDAGYSRLDNSNGDTDSIPNANRRERRPTEDDYFRSPDSYQWTDADNDQGQEPAVVDQGSHNYSGVSIQARKDKKPKKRSLRKRIRHFFRVSFKWMRRGLVSAAPVVTPQLAMNPAAVLEKHVAVQVQTSSKRMVSL